MLYWTVSHRCATSMALGMAQIPDQTVAMGRDAIVQRLIVQSNYAAALRAPGKMAPQEAAARRAVRAWQAARLARTHADLLASPHFNRAATFILSEVYDLKDLSRRDAAIKRMVPIMIKLLPLAGLETVEHAVELDALTESLDAAVVAALGPKVTDLDAVAYGQAYRQADRRADRERQIVLTELLGRALDRLARQPLIGSLLVMMRTPARLMGLRDLQDLLERGYGAVEGMNDFEAFLELVVTRERRLLKELFAGNDTLLDVTNLPSAEAAQSPESV